MNRNYFRWPTPITGNAFRVSLVVGTVLNLINQGNALFRQVAVSWPHVLLNYLVPFYVAYYSAVRAVDFLQAMDFVSEARPENNLTPQCPY
jgi:hypothetical protein